MAFKPNRAAIVADYQAKWDAMIILREPEVNDAARRILANWDAYKEVEKQTGVPAHVVGVLHMRECNNNMRGCLANGELIVGTNKKTRLVPKGRGPYATFLESAIDALALQGFQTWDDWSPGGCGYVLEEFNGWGYRINGVPSAYVLGATQYYKRGKYIFDGPKGWRPSVVDPQLGAFPVMKRVLEMAPKAQPVSFMGRYAAKRADVKAVAKKAAPKVHTVGEFLDYLGLGGVFTLGTLQQIGAFVIDWRTLSLGAAFLAAWGGFKWMKWKRVNTYSIPAADPPSENV